MIYVTGDTHGEIKRFTDDNIVGESTFTSEDILIISGDFGFVWGGEDVDGRKLDYLSEKPYTILFIDGNHENFRKLYEYPIEKKYGAPVHKIRDNIYHLQRGYVYEIEGKAFFVFGGALSIDRDLRVENEGWWKEELPCRAEYYRATHELRKRCCKVDYILTHTAPLWFYKQRNCAEPDEFSLGYFLNGIYEYVEFKHWYLGHMHQDISIDEKMTVVWKAVHKIE